MSVKVYFGKQTTKGTEATELVDLGVTDFSGGEKYNTIQSEVLSGASASGDKYLVGIDVNFSTPIEWSLKTLETAMPGIGYKGDGKKPNVYKIAEEGANYYTVILYDSLNKQVTKFVDTKMNTVTLNITKGALINGSIEWIGTKVEITDENDFGTTYKSKIAKSDRGETLVGLDAKIKLGSSPVEDIESVVLTINNALEAKGALNSIHAKRIVRTGLQTTELTVDFNYYDKARFKSIKDKAVNNQSEKLEIVLGGESKSNVKLEFPKLTIGSNERGDYKGEGTQNIAFGASINNSESSPMKITFTDITII